MICPVVSLLLAVEALSHPSHVRLAQSRHRQLHRPNCQQTHRGHRHGSGTEYDGFFRGGIVTGQVISVSGQSYGFILLSQ